MIVEYVKNIKNEIFFFTSFQLYIIKSYNLHIFFRVKDILTQNDSFIDLVEVIRQFMQ